MPDDDAYHRARALADEWRGMREAHDEAAVEQRFLHLDPHTIISMWETSTNPAGKPLSESDWVALCTAWLATFGELPPADADAIEKVVDEPPAPAPDTMLRFAEVIRLTGMSESTIKRRWADGSFPRPVKLSVRRIGWRADTVYAWLAAQVDRGRDDGTRH